MSDPDVNPIAKKLMNLSNSRGGKGNVRRKTPFYRKKWFGICVLLVVLGTVAAFAGLMIFLKPLREQAETFDMGALQKIEKASLIFDRRGEEFGRLYILNRTPIKIEQVPNHFIQALTAEEDSRFFEHSGVDMIGVFRAIWLNFKAGEETQGASTITQQLARDGFKLKDLETGTKNSRYARKIIEWFASERIEKNFRKSEILEMYLNRIYFGAGFYGVQAASQGYFSKNAEELTLPESAILVGLIKSPNNIQPLRHPERAKRARNQVFRRMSEEKMITEAEAARLGAEPVVTNPRESADQQSYVYETIRQQVVQLVGSEAALQGGFNIYTTVDTQLQRSVEDSVRKRLEAVESRSGYAHQTGAQYRAVLANYKKMINSKTISEDAPEPQPEYLQAAVLAIDNNDGGILAMVGGRDFRESEYNRALQSRRPPGTAFIPFVYAAAFQTPDYFPPKQLEDGPIDNRRVMIGGMTGILGEWGTERDETKYAASITAREALLQSRNAATVRLGEKISLGPVKALAAQAGIESPLRDFPSTFLGASEVKLDEMCLAYSSFANNGLRPSALTIIHRITDHEGKVIYQVSEDKLSPVRAMDEMAAYQTHSCLVDALKRGTGQPAYDEYGLQNFPAAGKTGTGYEFKDLWFVGYSSSITCGVWCGFDQQKTIYTGAFSNRVALPIWVDVMNAAKEEYKPAEFNVPVDAQMVETCRKSGMRATDACYEKTVDPVTQATKAVRDTYMEALRPGTVFDTYCDVHKGGMPLADYVIPSSPHESYYNTFTAAEAVASNTQPVRMQGITVLGIDPYNTVQPILRAEPVDDEGTKVMRALPVEDATTEQAPIKLAPPPPIKLD